MPRNNSIFVRETADLLGFEVSQVADPAGLATIEPGWREYVAVDALLSDEAVRAAGEGFKAAYTDYEGHLRDALKAVADALTGEQSAAPGRGLCERVLVGRGTDTWDPLCGRLKGHEGPCE